MWIFLRPRTPQVNKNYQLSMAIIYRCQCSFISFILKLYLYARTILGYTRSRQYTFKALICRMNYIFNPIENVVTTSWFIWYIQGQTYKRKMQSAISIEFQSVSLHIYICTWPHSSFGILKCWRRITFRLSRESVRYHHNWRKRDLILSKKHKTYYHCDL